MQLPDILMRIESRLKALGLSAHAASVAAGKPYAIRNIRRAAQSGNRQGVSTATIAALAPALQTSVGWLVTGQDGEIGESIDSEIVPGESIDAYHSEMLMGATIRDLRKRAGLSQAALAEKLGLSTQAVSNWERDADLPSQQHIVALADILAVSVDELYQRRVSPARLEEGPIDLDLLKALLRPVFELRGLDQAQARNLVEALLTEARTPPDPSRGVPDEIEIRIRVETLLRSFGRKSP